jgi:DNA polymerase-1
LYGRKRYLPELKSEDFYLRSSAERKAMNTPVQGTAADIMKMAMINLNKAGYPVQLVVHDEVILSVDSEDVEFALEDIKHIMETTVKLDVPLKVKISSGGNWDEAKS